MARSRSGSKSPGNFTTQDLKKTDFLVLRDSATGVIKKVIAPNGLQVGLLDEAFISDVFVTGHISGSGVIRAKHGFTGSLTKLHTGGDYLVGGTNISLVTGSDGSVTISTAASFTGTTTEVLTIGSGLQLDSGTTFDGSAARTLSLDIAGQSSVTPASGDLILIADVDDSNNLKKVTVSSIQASLDIAGLSDSLTESTVATGDLFAIADINDGNNVKKITIEDVGQYLASSTNGGIGESSGKLTVDLNELSSATVSVSSDSIVIIDSDDGNATKKESISDFVDAIRGTTTTSGLNSSSGVLNVDINSMPSVVVGTPDELLVYDISTSTLKKTTVGAIQGAGAAIDIAGLSSSLTESTLASGDLLAVADVNDGDTVKKITTEDFGQYLASETNSGIGESSGKLTIDLNDLSAATVAVASDSIAFIDSDDNTTKKESIVDLVSGIAGSGLSAGSGQLSLTSNSVTITAGDGLKDGGSVSLGSSVTMNIDVSDFAGTGLEDDGSENLRIASSAAGTGLTGGGGSALSVDFGATSTTVAKGNNTITIVPGDGLTTGGTATIGNTSTSITLDINPTDFAGNGLKVVSNDLAIDDSIVATVSGSTFAGDLIVTGSVYATGILSGSSVKATKLSGSLTTLADGSAYLIAGDNILITTGSSGAITITGSSYTAGTGLNLNGYEFSVDNSVVATLTGSQFSGNVGVTGSLGVTSFVTSSIFRGSSLSGSLTTLQDGSAYLRAGTNIQLSTGSDGAITITAAGSGLGTITEVIAGSGLTGGGNTGAVTLDVDNSVIATLTGSQFSGNVGVTGSFGATTFITSSIFRGQSLSGSLTTLQNGDPYLLAGTGISLATGSDGSITITGNVGDITGVTAGTGLTGGGNTGDVTLNVDNTVVATLTGSQFSGNVGVTGSIGSTTFVTSSILKGKALSGSLTTLQDGSPYLIAGSNIALSTGSNGAVTITSTAAGTIDGSGAANRIATWADADTLTSDSDLTWDGTTLYASSGGITLNVQGNTVLNGTVVVNQSGDDKDFRVETQNKVHAFQVDGGTDMVLLFSGSNTDASGFGSSASDPDPKTFTDTNFFVSGSIGSRGSTTKGSSVFGGDVVASGSLNALNGISGSLTKLSDGTSYLIAGSNVTISTGSNGAVTISSSGGGGGGSITTVSGSTSVSNVSTIRFGPGLIMNEDASGISSVTASIGEAEDGVYTDGLFLDFTPLTPIGTAIDRFNEILAALSPSPAPVLDDKGVDTSNGITALLSFGASNDQTSESPSYPSVTAAAGISSAVDVNGSYSATTSGNNIRLGIYDGTQAITGTLNDDVTSNSQGGGVQNYPDNSFGDGDTGVLKLEVNGSVVHETDLTVFSGTGGSGLGTGTSVNSNQSGFINLSTATTGTFSNGNSFATFKHRTGKYTVGTADQRNGWNYARVQHVKTGSTTTTNYVEWVNDNNADALASSNSDLTFDGSGSIHLSGVEYYQSGNLVYNNKVDHAYKYIYDNNNITFSTSNSSALSSGLSFSFAAQSKPTIDTGGGETHTKALHLTSSADIDANFFISGSVTVGSNVTHPRKTNLSNSGQASVDGILMYNLSNTSTAQSETFRRENFRIISGSYTTQNAVTASANIWDSSVYMTASNGGHSNGLQFYNSLLLSPLNTLNSGNFSTLNNGPTNPNYSGVTGNRTFYRWFKNETGSTQYDFSLAINGSSTIVQDGTTLDTSKINVFVKYPSGTGWLDVAREFVLDSISDGDGAHVDNTQLNFDSTLNATNYINFGNIGIADDGYVVLKIIADESWTGNVSSITVSFGAGTGTLTHIPDLDDIDSDNTGVTANLSFGSSKSITDYTNVGTGAGHSAADINALYQTAESSNNLRRAVFNGSTVFEGDLNEDVTSPGLDFVANAFSAANTGSLKLEVNGVVIHTVEITGSFNLVGAGDPGSGTDTSLNGNGSGFISLSTWAPGLFDNGVPRYGNIQRTGRYRVATSDQRNGWNYVRVIHSVTGTDRTTNYVEWVNDNDSNALSSAGNNLGIFGDNSHSYLSGIKYFNSPSGSLESRISNIYKNVYSDESNAISFTNLTNATASKIIQAGTGLSSTKTTSSSTDSLQTLNSSTDSQNQVLNVTGTINFSRSKSLPGDFTTAYSCAGAMVFIHPQKSNLTTPTQTTTNMLVWTPSDTSNANTTENFTGETYRLVSGSYTAQAHVSGGSYDWNSQRSVNDQGSYPEHATGMIVYDTYAISPKKGGASGDFRNHEEGGSIESPAGNVNYSSLTNSTRDYFRGFLNNTTNDRPSVQVTLYGDATIVGRVGANAGTLGTNKNIFVEVGIPGKTGLLDLGRPSAGSGNYDEGDGCLSGDLDATVDGSGATNTCTFNGRTADGTVSGAEYIVVRISASENWTGYIDQITIGWS